MIVAIHQPHYLPWLGYFYKILKSNIFVFLNNVQFEKGGFCNRKHRQGSFVDSRPCIVKGSGARDIGKAFARVMLEHLTLIVMPKPSPRFMNRPRRR